MLLAASRVGMVDIDSLDRGCRHERRRLERQGHQLRFHAAARSSPGRAWRPDRHVQARHPPFDGFPRLGPSSSWTSDMIKMQVGNRTTPSQFAPPADDSPGSVDTSDGFGGKGRILRAASRNVGRVSVLHRPLAPLRTVTVVRTRQPFEFRFFLTPEPYWRPMSLLTRIGCDGVRVPW